MKKLCALFVIFNIYFVAFGVFLDNLPYQLIQPNGNVLNVFITGDEFYQRVHDADDYSIVQGSDGWYYYALYDASADELIPSDFIVTEPRSVELPIEKGLGISYGKYIQIRQNHYEPTGCDLSGASKSSILDDLANNNEKTTQQMNNIIICIGFSDSQTMTQGYNYVNGMFNTNEGNNLKDYFSTMSYNKISVESHFFPPANGNILRFYQDTHPRDYFRPYANDNPLGYSGDSQRTQREHTLLKDAIEWVNENWPVPATLNLDINNDGRCDYITFVIYGGVGAWSSLLWPHKWSLYSYTVKINGKRVYDYNFELDGTSTYFNVGTFCHEGYHQLGAPDLYHYNNYTQRSAVGSYDIMENTNNKKPQSMSAYMKYNYGSWVASLPVATINQTYEIFPFYSNDGTDPAKPVIYRIPMTGTTTQYSVVEYRKKSGTNYDNSIPNQGLLVYRINSGMNGNAQFNATSVFDEVYLYRPGSSQTNGVYSQGTLETAPFGTSTGRTTFYNTTDPKPCLSNGTTETTQHINNILYDAETDSYTFFYGDPATRNISVDNTEITLGKYSGSTGAISITSNVVWNVSVSENAASWLSVSHNKGINSATLQFATLNNNFSGALKSADVTISGNGQTFIITVYQDVAVLDCMLSEDFEEISPTNPGYAGSIVTSPSGEWMILGYGTMDVNDRRIGERSIRLRANNNDPANNAMTIPGENTTGANVIQMQWDKPNGVGVVSFLYGSYSAHYDGIIYVEYSTDGGTTWISPENNSVTSPKWENAGEEMLEFSVQINQQGNVRIRIIKYKQSGTNNSVNIDNICVTDFNESGYVSSPTFNPPSGTYYLPQTVMIASATEDAIIRYTLDGSDVLDNSEIYTTPISISENTTIRARAWKEGMVPSSTSMANYTFPIEVPNIAAFKAANPTTSSTLYKITGDVTFVYRNIYSTGTTANRYIYIKDASGGLLIFDDTNPVITNTYNNGDIISGGVIGTCTIYNGLYELVPKANVAPGTPGTPVAPISLTMADLLENFADYESQLIKLEVVAFDEGSFETTQNINIFQDDNQMVCRNHFGMLGDFTPNTDIFYDVAGFAIPFNADKQIAPRDSEDISVSKPLLTGTVTITGLAVFGETLTAVTDLSSSETTEIGDLTYQWLRNNILVGTNSTNYTLLQSDIGFKIKVTVTAANCSGSVSSAETDIVTKATQTPPNAPELESKTDVRITLKVISGCEYRRDGGAWQTSNAFSGLLPETTYSFEARKVETATHLPSTPGPATDITTDPIGIGENVLNNVHVYSFLNSVYIKNDAHVDIQFVEIFDMTGRMVYQSTVNSPETVITLNLTTGIYHVILLGEDVARNIKVLITR